MKRGAVVGIVAGAAVLVAGAGVAVWALTRPSSPESAAETYLRALSQGDLGTIRELLPDTVDTSQLESSFLGASGYISDYSFTLEDAGDGLVSARADVQIDGRPGVVGFILGEDDGRWALSADFLAVLEVTTTLGDSVHVGDALTGLSTPLLPAVYPISAAPAGILAGSTEAVVTNEDTVRVSIDAAVAPEATPLAQEQLDAYAQECTAPATEVPSNCGLRVPWAADFAALDDIRFHIERLPALALAPDGRTFAATGGVVVATAIGTTREGAAASVTYRADDWALRGTIRFTGDEMVLRVG